MMYNIFLYINKEKKKDQNKVKLIKKYCKKKKLLYIYILFMRIKNNFKINFFTFYTFFIKEILLLILKYIYIYIYSYIHIYKFILNYIN